MPKYEFDFIQGLRTRTPGERHVGVYLDEIFKEALHLERGIWSPSLHDGLPAEQQSPYLNFLAQKAALDGVPVRAGHALDANYLLYQTMAVNEPDRWLAHLNLIKEVKNQELERFKASAPDIFSPNDKITVKAVVKLIEKICSATGLTAELWSDGEKIVVTRKIDDGCFVSASWDDLSSLKKRWDFQFTYRVHDAPVEFDTADNKNWLFGANGLIPGEYWYGWNNASWEGVALAVYANLAFLKLMIQ